MSLARTPPASSRIGGPGLALALVSAARPKTLPASVVPVSVGSAVALGEGSFRPEIFVLALAGALAIQIGTNFVNDVADFEKGADGVDRVGPVRAVAAGLVSPGTMKLGAVLAFLMAAAAGLGLSSISGPWVVPVGLASILAGVAYTAGPWPLAYAGLGDVFVFVFFGLVAVLGTVFAHLGRLPSAGLAAAVSVGALSTLMLAINNLRDRHTDAKARKRTLAVRFGGRFVVGECVTLVGLAYLAPIVQVVLGASSIRFALPILSLPLAVRLLFRCARLEGPGLNEVLAESGRLLVVFGLLLALGTA